MYYISCRDGFPLVYTLCKDRQAHKWVFWSCTGNFGFPRTIVFLDKNAIKFAWIGINCLLKLDSMDPTASGNAVGCIWWLPTCTAVQGTATGSPWDTIYASCSTSGGCEGAHSFFCPLDCSLFIIRKTRDARKLDTKDLWDARVEGQARELNYNTW